jgi:hypothetical protein
VYGLDSSGSGERLVAGFCEHGNEPSGSIEWRATVAFEGLGFGIMFIIIIVFNNFHAHKQKKDSAVGIATGYGLDDGGVGLRVSVGSRMFSFPRRSYRLWGHPASYPMGTGVSFPGGKAAGALSWPLTSTSAKVKKTWIYTSTPPYALWCIA